MGVVRQPECPLLQLVGGPPRLALHEDTRASPFQSTSWCSGISDISYNKRSNPQMNRCSATKRHHAAHDVLVCCIIIIIHTINLKRKEIANESSETPIANGRTA